MRRKKKIKLYSKSKNKNKLHILILFSSLPQFPQQLNKQLIKFHHLQCFPITIPVPNTEMKKGNFKVCANKKKLYNSFLISNLLGFSRKPNKTWRNEKKKPSTFMQKFNSKSKLQNFILFSSLPHFSQQPNTLIGPHQKSAFSNNKFKSRRHR